LIEGKPKDGLWVLFLWKNTTINNPAINKTRLKYVTPGELHSFHHKHHNITLLHEIVIESIIIE